MERRLTLIQGDLTMLPLRDGGIINPTNSGLILTQRGIGAQIARRAGPLMQQTLHTERSRLRHSRLEPGNVLVTDAGQLPASKLIHIAIVGGRKVTPRMISRGLIAAYDAAEEHGLRTIGLPPVGPGVSKFELDAFLEIFWRINAEELPEHESLEDVYLCLDNEADFAHVRDFARERADDLPESLSLVVSESGISMGMFSSGLAAT